MATRYPNQQAHPTQSYPLQGQTPSYEYNPDLDQPCTTVSLSLSPLPSLLLWPLHSPQLPSPPLCLHQRRTIHHLGSGRSSVLSHHNDHLWCFHCLPALHCARVDLGHCGNAEQRVLSEDQRWPKHWSQCHCSCLLHGFGLCHDPPSFSLVCLATGPWKVTEKSYCSRRVCVCE